MAKYNLNEEILDAEGLPIPDKNMKIYPLKEKQDVEVYVGEKKTDTISAVAVIKEFPKLTYRQAIRRALNKLASEKDNEQKKLECGDLIFKLIADTDVDLSFDDRILAYEAVKSHNDNVEVIIRVRNLLSPEEAKADQSKEN